jgi:hypothetical protein
MLATMREDRDAWREQAGKITAAFTCSCPCCAPRYAPELVAATGMLDTRRNP